MGAKGLSDERVRELRTRLVVNGENLTALAREFGVSRNHAYRIAIGEYRIAAGGPLYEPGIGWLTGRAVATQLNADDRELVLKLIADGAKPERVASVMMCTLRQVMQALEGR